MDDHPPSVEVGMLVVLSVTDVLVLPVDKLDWVVPSTGMVDAEPSGCKLKINQESHSQTV